MKIKDLPKDSRPRERFLKYGPETLSDAELFALLLRTGSKGENVIDMSNRLIAEYGLDKLFECSLKELQEIKGIGPNKAMQILTMNEILKRIHLSEKPIIKITRAEDVFNLFHDRLKDEKKEKFIVLHLNTKSKIIKEEVISLGTLDSSIFSPTDVFKNAMKNSTSKIILVHNHPSGDPTPSAEDIEITKRLIEIGNLVGINVLDHVIIGREGFWGWKNLKNF